MNKSEQLIACLEGEIAKQDEELAACRVTVENCEVFRARIAELEDDLKCAHSMLAEVSKAGMALRAELSAIKAQEPVAWAGAIEYGVPLLMVEPQNWKATPLYAAPVSEAKARDFDPLVCDYCNAETQDPWHGSGMLNGVESRHIHACSQCRNLLPTAKAQCVVQWPDADEIMQMAFEEGQPADDASWYYFELEEFDLFIERLMSEVARLNAAPAAAAADAGLVEARKANNELVNDLHVMTNKSRQLVDALTYLRECLDPEDYMGEISMHDFIDDALAAHRAQELTKEPSHD